MISRFKPHILMVLSHIAYSVLYFITEAAFNHGQNTQVYVTYRHVVAAVIMLPFAYFLERKERPKLTWGSILEMFVLSLLGALSVNMYYASLKYTSPTFLASTINSVASLTFVVAVLLGLETLDIKSSSGIAKICGTVLSMVGVLTMSLCRGTWIRNSGRTLIHIHRGGAIHEDWVKGPILTIASCLAVSGWYILQAYTLKRYPARLSLATWVTFMGAAETAIFAVAVEHKQEAWAIKWNIELWSTLYGGVVISSVIIYIQLWCTKERGPVFVTMFNPLSTVMVALAAYFVFGEKLYMGSIIGAVLVIISLYLMLWGKDEDQKNGCKSKAGLETSSAVGWKSSSEESNACEEEMKESQSGINRV